MKFFDCHAHLGLVNSDPIERLRIVQEAKRSGVQWIINISNNLQDFRKVYESMSGISQVLYAAGFAPEEAGTLPIDWQNQLEKTLPLENVVCVGAVGLDYSNSINRKTQIELFVRQLDIARKFNKPVLVYNRNAGDDVKSILQESAPKEGVIFHCFSETYEYAFQALQDFNFPTYFGFAGNVTFKNSRALHNAVLELPLENIVVESVSPFLTPTAFSGTKNVPSNIFATVEFIAELLDEDFEIVANTIYENSLKAFHLGA